MGPGGMTGQEQRRFPPIWQANICRSPPNRPGRVVHKRGKPRLRVKPVVGNDHGVAALRQRVCDEAVLAPFAGFPATTIEKNDDRRVFRREIGAVDIQFLARKISVDYTGLALVNAATGVVQQDVVSYRVLYRTLSLQQIEQYLDLDEPYGCCGSLRAESLGIALLRDLSGPDPSALIGLPLISLVGMLNAEGVDVLDSGQSMKLQT